MALHRRTTWLLAASLVISGGGLAAVRITQSEGEPRFCTADARLGVGDGHTYHRDHDNNCLWTDERGVVDPNQ